MPIPNEFLDKYYFDAMGVWDACDASIGRNRLAILWQASLPEDLYTRTWRSLMRFQQAAICKALFEDAPLQEPRD